MGEVTNAKESSFSGTDRQADDATRSFRLGYRRSLDGFRGIAILLVLGGHTYLIPDAYGFMGVSLFFTLSGFLITALLLEEWQDTRQIRLSAFYARRALRLLPALLALLAIFVVYALTVGTVQSLRTEMLGALASLFYCMNWVVVVDRLPVNMMRHTWSLSIEEQFYFLWPPALKWALGRCSRTILLWGVMLLAMLSWALRFFLFRGTTVTTGRLAVGLDTRADSLLLGCALAVALASGWRPTAGWSRAMVRWTPPVATVVLVVMCYIFSFADSFMYDLGWFLMSLAAAVIILKLVIAPGRIAATVLEHPVLVFIGKISYGLYLWNWPVFRAVERLETWSLWQKNLVGLVVITGFTLASYYWVERPCLRLKKRFQVVG